MPERFDDGEADEPADEPVHEWEKIRELIRPFAPVPVDADERQKEMILDDIAITIEDEIMGLLVAEEKRRRGKEWEDGELDAFWEQARKTAINKVLNAK